MSWILVTDGFEFVSSHESPAEAAIASALVANESDGRIVTRVIDTGQPELFDQPGALSPRETARTMPLANAEPMDCVTGHFSPSAGRRQAILVDIDGTVALRGVRSPYDLSRVGEDAPHGIVIRAVEALHRAGWAVVFCSGREETAREDTEAWLREHVAVQDWELVMRPRGDYRRDYAVKQELYATKIGPHFDVQLVLDDRQSVVDMWRSLGLTCFAVADGDF